MKYLQRDEHKTMFGAHWLVLCAVTVLFGAMLHAVPAWAVHFVALERLDVDCSKSLHLNQATGVPAAAFHTYAFGGGL